MHHNKLKSKFIHSLGSKLILLIAILIICISWFIYAFFPNKVEMMLIRSLENRGHSIATMTAYSVRAALDFGSKYDIDNAFNVARQNKDIEFMVLKDILGETVSSYNLPKAEKYTYDQLIDNKKITNDGNIFIIKVPVAKDGREIGELYVGLSFVELKNEVFLIKTIIAIICFLIAIVGIVAAFFISKIITHPLRQLVATFNEIAGGNLSKRAAIKSKDEVGILGNTFDNMVDKLESAYTALEGTNKSLQSEILEREKIEKIVRESEERYRLLVDELPDLIIVHQDMKFIFINNVVSDLLGYQPEELIGKKLFDIIPEEYMKKALDRIQMRFKGEKVESYELELINKKNERLFFETRGTIVSYNNLPATLSVLTNITERKKFEQELQKANEELEQRVEERTSELKDAIDELQNQIQVRKLAEESLRESEEKFKALAEYSIDGIMRFDKDLKHLYVNKAHADSVGIHAEKFIGKTFSQLGFPEHLIEFWRTAINRVFDTKEPYRIEFENLNHTWVDWSLSPEFDQDGRVKSVLSSARDVTERKKTEHELIAAREKALEASRLKSEFLANMSHEIRTPLNGIIGMTNLLQNTEQSDEQLEFTHIIKSSGNVLLNIINDILDFSKIEAGRLELEVIDFNLRYVVEEAVEIFAQKAHEKHLELISFVYPEIPINLKGDPARLRQIIINLIGNAIKFTSHGEIVVTATLELIEGENIVVKISVKDTGIGIDKEAREKLFQPFTQADGSTTRKYGGTGLGLSISKRLVEMMGGEIGVESIINHGSTFYFTAVFGVSDGENYDSQPLDNVTGIRVLIVDDNSTNRKILQYQTASLKMDSATADNGFSAIEMLKRAVKENNPFQIAILDQLMPELDGLDLARMIKDDDEIKETKLLMLTSFGELTKKVLKEHGIASYLNKPVKQSALFDSIAGCLGESAFIEKNDIHDPFEGERKIPVVDHLQVLIAEDNTTNQKVAYHMLKRLGFRHMDIVANGIEAENAVAKKEYDIVFMDCQMPERDGFEATKNIRKSELKRNVIIAMTANALHGDREKCLAVGMDDYISKPINVKLLEAAVKKWALIINKKRNVIDPEVDNIKHGNSLLNAEKTEKVPETNISYDTELYVDVEQIEILKGLGGEDEPDLINQFIDTYLQDTPADMERLGNAVKARDAKELKAAAHKVKGASGNIGAKIMQQLSLTLELKGKNEDLTGIDEIYNELMECFTKTGNALKEFLV